jgi:predicted nucleotide-binding protein
MRKHKTYPMVRLDSTAFSEVDKCLPSGEKDNKKHSSLGVDFGQPGKWYFDTLAEFLAAADEGEPYYMARASEAEISIYSHPSSTRVEVTAQTRDQIEQIFSVVEKHADRCRILEPDEADEGKKIFVGHGRDAQWRDLKDHLHEKHKYEIVAYEIGSREGHTIRDILEDMMDEASVALLVMTGENEDKDGTMRARQNVVHEAGLFQGRLGFSRAIVLLEEGTEEFSNIHGLQQIRFSKGKIRETFGDVLAVLKRELG